MCIYIYIIKKFTQTNMIFIIKKKNSIKLSLYLKIFKDIFFLKLDNNTRVLIIANWDAMILSFSYMFNIESYINLHGWAGLSMTKSNFM